METLVESRAEPVVDQVRRALAWQAERRRWRDVGVMCLGGLVAYSGEIGTLVILAGRGASIGGHGRLPVSAALWAGGALVASLGWHRLRPARALVRFPLVAGTLTVWLPVYLLLTSIRRGRDGAATTGPTVPGVRRGGSALAMALVDLDFARAMLGGAFTGPLPIDGFLVRSESMARLHAGNRELTVLVGRDPGGARREAAPRGVQTRSRSAWVWGGVGDWTIQMSLLGAEKDAAQMVAIALAAAEYRLATALAA
ncbi:MAG TPA: hypothetical protein VF112_07280 [Candidatus Dormibacteraeota bacterium]